MILCVSGADGCGKTTLVAGLARALPGACVVTIWDLMADPAASPIFANKAQLQTFLGCLAPESRSLFLMSCLKAAMERAASPVVLVDSYWYKYVANEIALGGEPARLQALVGFFTAPSLVLRVDLPPVLAAERKRGVYSPYECGLRAPTTEHFVEFQTRTTSIVRSLIEADCPHVITLDGTEPVAGLLAQALAHVARVRG
ncbi:hypothetical protein LBMAG42_31370 [Deltaproteobacteria bacterium]|nr:hypothetical protein LBMAG42_31370 [Deltaproteobacteria bacterium]